MIGIIGAMDIEIQELKEHMENSVYENISGIDFISGKLFGKNAELLIDHAWGWEPCTIEAIKAYKPSTNSLGSGQVLQHPYEYDKAKLVLREMADLLVLDLVDKGLVTNQIVITIGYDIENLTDPIRRKNYKGEIL